MKNVLRGVGQCLVVMSAFYSCHHIDSKLFDFFLRLLLLLPPLLPLHLLLYSPLFTLPSCRSFHPIFNSSALQVLHLFLCVPSPYLSSALPTPLPVLSHLCPHRFPRFEAPLHLRVFIHFGGVRVFGFFAPFTLTVTSLSFSPPLRPLTPTFCIAQCQVRISFLQQDSRRNLRKRQTDRSRPPACLPDS